MTLREYIEEQYPIDKLIEKVVSDPYTRVMEADVLPYDKICMFDGKLQKVVEISDDEVIPVVDLLSLEEQDLKGCSPEFVDTYRAYMDNVVLEDVNVQEIMGISRNYKKNKEKKLERIS